MGPQQSSVSLWQGNALHSGTTPQPLPWLMTARGKRKSSEGKTKRPQRVALHTQVWLSTWSRHTCPEGEVGPNALQSGTLLFLQLIFSNFLNEQRKTGTTIFSQNPSKLTKEQNITVKLIRGLTVTKAMYCTLLIILTFHDSDLRQFEDKPVWSVSFHSILSVYCSVFPQLLKHYTYWRGQNAQGW